ncbi:MAG: restriction endonuclease [Ramlibacter sp.]|nr:restriction endonuclease [Ramlibacter sp.]
MARRKRQSTAEDIMDLVARLPWWAGVALALASYVFFHWFAGRPQPKLTGPGQVADVLSFVMVGGLAKGLQYVAPMLCLVGAAISAVRRRKRAGLVASVTGAKSADALNGMSWREFELLVGEAFRLQGYEVKEQGGAQPDGGVDVVLRKGTETFLVQCKQWKATKVGVQVVRELYGVMAAQGAAGGFVVTSGRFTDDAVAFAAGRNLRLLDGPKLFGLLQQAKAGAPASRPASASPTARTPANPVAAAAPECPKCSGPMVQRTAKKGATPGAQFWGCSRFPVCYGVRNQPA